MLEGGSALNWGMISAHLVDEIRITIAPVIVGGSDATSLVSGEGYLEVEDGVKLELLDITSFDGFLRVKYKVL
jgi:2,5-diamino-6-(ribosylamino)-4(3H)-pyrimidinone 5'-phosphate reductase